MFENEIELEIELEPNTVGFVVYDLDKSRITAVFLA